MTRRKSNDYSHCTHSSRLFFVPVTECPVHHCVGNRNCTYSSYWFRLGTSVASTLNRLVVIGLRALGSSLARAHSYVDTITWVNFSPLFTGCTQHKHFQLDRIRERGLPARLGRGPLTRQLHSVSPHTAPRVLCGDSARRARKSMRARPLLFGGSSSTSRGKSSCTGTYRSESRARLKSTDKKVGCPTKLSALLNSPLSQGFYGLSRQPRHSLRSPSAISEQPNAGSPVNSSRPTSSLKR